MLFYTDGITDTENQSGQFYGQDKMIRCVEAQTVKTPAFIIRHFSRISIATSVRAINRTTSPYWRSNTKGFREANDLLAVKILIDRLQIGFQQAAIFFYTVFLDKSLAL